VDYFSIKLNGKRNDKANLLSLFLLTSLPNWTCFMCLLALFQCVFFCALYTRKSPCFHYSSGVFGFGPVTFFATNWLNLWARLTRVCLYLN